MKSHFLPHPKKGTRAKLLSPTAFFGYIFFVCSLIFTTKIISLKYPLILGYATNVRVEDLLEYTNLERQQLGLQSLKLDSKLNNAAYSKATDMFSNNYWAHTSPSGVQPWSFIVDSGYDYIYAGENLARDFNNSKSVIKAWMNSPTHRDNIISSNYEQIGFAVVNGKLNGEETTLVVEMFGSLKTPDYLAVNNVEGVKTLIEKDFKAIPIPILNVKTLNRNVSLVIMLFVLFLFILDGLYVWKKGIVRISGNTLAHILILLIAIVGVWYTSLGSIL